MLPAVALVVGSGLLMFGGGDLWLAKQLYALQGGAWALKQAFITEGLIHRGGRLLSALAWLGLLGFLGGSVLSGRGLRWRRAASYLLLSVLCSVALVTALKRTLTVDCAWSVEGLGGNRSHLTLLDPRPATYPSDHCFPAAHASAGYAWLALYFAGFGSLRTRRIGLAVGLGAGLLFGVSQQLRGAHFASHDLWAAVICWTVALLWRPLLREASA